MTEQLTERPAEAEVETQSGPPAPVRVSWAPIARVNLLPIEIIDSRRFRRTQAMLGGAVVGALLIAGGGTYLTQREVNQARAELATAQARVSTLEAQQAKYASVPQVIAQVDAAKAAQTQSMGSEVLWYRYLSDLDGARPAGVEFTGLTVAMNAASATSAGDALSPGGLGLLTIDGTSEQYAQVASWLERLDKITGIDSSSLTNATKGKDELTFTSGATVTTDALSGRYNKKAG